MEVAAGALTSGQELEIKSPTLLRSIPTGSFLETKSIGTLNAAPGSVVSIQRATRNGVSTIHEIIDLSPTGAPSVVVAGYKGGIAQQHSDFSGSIFTADMNLGGGAGAVTDWSISFPPFDIDITGDFASASATDGAATMSLSGPGHLMYLFTPKSANSITAISATQTRGGGGLTSITITDEAIQSTPTSVPAAQGWMLVFGAALLLASGTIVLSMRNRGAIGPQRFQ